MPDVGWYQNPLDPPGTSRWWDGERWTRRVRTGEEAPDDAADGLAQPRADSAPDAAVEPARTTSADRRPLGGIGREDAASRTYPSDPYPAPGGYLLPNSFPSSTPQHVDDETVIRRVKYRASWPRRIAVAFGILLLLAALGIVAFLGVGLNDDGNPDDDAVASTTTAAASTTTSTAAATTSTQQTVPASTTPPAIPPYVSRKGWQMTVPDTWVTVSDDADTNVKLWMLSTGAIVGVEVTENDVGFVVTPESIKAGIDKFMAESFEVDGDVKTADTSLGGQWAVRADAADAKTRAIVIVGSPGRSTYVVSLSGSPDQVNAGLAEFELVTTSFGYR